MVVLREGMCPGLDEDLLRDLRGADVKTGLYPVSRSNIGGSRASITRFPCFTVEDLVSSDVEGLAQKCSVSYKVCL